MSSGLTVDKTNLPWAEVENFQSAGKSNLIGEEFTVIRVKLCPLTKK